MKAKDYFEEKKPNMRELWNLSDTQKEMIYLLMEQYAEMHKADVFAIGARTFSFSGFANGVKFVINLQAPNRESAIAHFENEYPQLEWRMTTEIADFS